MSRHWLLPLVLVACQSSSPVAPEAPLLEGSTAPAPANKGPEVDEGQRAAEAAELAWYADDPTRRAHVAGLPAPQGDACRVSFDEAQGVFVVAGIPVFFPNEDLLEPGTWAGGSETSILNVRRAQALFVGFGRGLEMHDYRLISGGGMGPSPHASTLWRIDCARLPLRPVAFYVAPEEERDAIDFGNAVVDGDVLYVANRVGIARLSLVDGSLEQALVAPPCDVTGLFELPDEGTFCTTVLSPERLTPDGLLISVGVPEASCHSNGPDVSEYLVDVSHASARDPHTWRRPTSISAFAAVGETWWLGSSRLWRSNDAGVSWAVVDFGAVDDKGERYEPYGVESILVDARDPKRMVVLPSPRQEYESFGASELFVTRDGGKRWRRVGLGEGVPAVRVWSLDGSVDQLRIRRAYPYSDDASEARTLESRDGGATWHEVEGVMPEQPLVLPAGLERSALGLWRAAPERTLIFPPPNLRQPLGIYGVPLEPTSRTPIDWDTWDRAAAANKRGLTHAKAKRYEDAIAAYEQAWTINPNNAYARYNAACAYALMGKSKEAMALIEALHALRGHRALALLEAAATDKDLVSLRKLARFRVLTAATAPLSAYDFGAEMNEALELPDTIMSDRAERMCLWAESVEPDDAPLELARFDCRTSAPSALRGSAKEIYAVLDELGMVAWSRLQEDAPANQKAYEWATTATAPHTANTTDSNLSLYRSPSGRRLAARVTYSNDEGYIAKVIFGDWPK